MGSPLYAHLLERAADDAAAGGPVLRARRAVRRTNLRADALALRLMAAVHRLVLAGASPAALGPLPDRRRHARGPDGAWEAFRELVIEQQDRLLQPLVAQPCQTNEVGRCAPLAFGFLELASIYRLPLRLARGRRQRRPQPALRPLPLRRWRRRVGTAREPGRPRRACGSRLPRTCRLRWRSSSGAAATVGRSTSRRPRDACSSSRRSGPTRSRDSDACAARSRWPRASPRASSKPRSRRGCPRCSPSRGPASRRWSTTRSSTSTSRTPCAARSTRRSTARGRRHA